MSVQNELIKRSNAKCELCGNSEELNVYNVANDNEDNIATCIFLCNVCENELSNLENGNVKHWYCLKDSMWSQVPAVQAMSFRILNKLSNEGWARDLLDMLYLDEDVLALANSDSQKAEFEEEKHIDSNGVELNAGDTVVIIKDLNVKGTSFTAKRGTAVRGISLVMDNPSQIVGKINGQEIVILTKFVKKS